ALLVQEPLLVLGRLAQPFLQLGIGDDHERPGLLIRTGRSRAGRPDRVLDQLCWDGLVREVPYRAAPLHQLEEGARTGEGLALGKPLELERNSFVPLDRPHGAEQASRVVARSASTRRGRLRFPVSASESR